MLCGALYVCTRPILARDRIVGNKNGGPLKRRTLTTAWQLDTQIRYTPSESIVNSPH